METHSKYIIFGGIMCAEGGPFLFIGLMFGWLVRISEDLGMGIFPTFMILPCIIIGAISLVIGGTFLLIGLIKRNQVYKAYNLRDY